MSISFDFEAEDLSMCAGYYEVEAIFVSLRTERIKIHLQIIRGGQGSFIARLLKFLEGYIP